MFWHLTRLLSLAAILTTSSAVAQDEPPAAEAAQKEGVEVELLEAGEAPRRAIRYQPTKGEKSAVVMSMKMSQAISINGQQLPSTAVPEQKITIAFSVVDVSPEGDIRMDYEYTDVQVVDDPDNPSPVQAALEKMTTPLKGATGTVLLTDRGITKEAELNVPPDVPQQLRAMLDSMKQSLEKLSLPMPEEEVGVGGKWRVTQQMKMMGMEFTQTSVCELTDADQQNYGIDIELTQEAAQQKINPPGLPPGAEVTLESLDTDGEGRLELSTASIVPTKSHMSVNSTTNMSIAVGGENQALSTEMKSEVNFAPAPEAPPEASETPGE